MKTFLYHIYINHIGVNVLQDTVLGQIIDVYPGKLVRQPACPMMVGESLFPPPPGQPSRCLASRIRSFFHSLSTLSQAFVITLSGLFLGALAAIVAKWALLVVLLRRQKQPQYVVLGAVVDSATDNEDEKCIFDEKK